MTGAYLYCVSRADIAFGIETTGLGGHAVRRVAGLELAAIVSDCRPGEIPISRENMMTHQQVMLEAMAAGDILPVRFATVARALDGKTPEEIIQEKLLRGRRDELLRLLDGARGKVELGVKVLWTDMEAVFQALAAESPEIRRLRPCLKAGQAAHHKRAALGEAVRDALLARKEAEAGHLLEELKGLAADFRVNKTFGDRMVLNAAFLVDRAGQAEFAEAAQSLARGNEGRLLLRLAGPMPISNFVELTLSWD